MSWLADLLKPPLKPVTPMAIELAQSEPTTSPAPVHAIPPVTVVAPVYPVLHSDGPLDAETLERHLEGACNPRLQGLAKRVAAARSRLADLTEAATVLSMAMDAAHFMGTTAEGWMENDLAEVLAQIEQAEAGRKRAEARRVARSARVTPLTIAVSKLQTELVRERDVLKERVYLLRKGTGQDKSPEHHLRQAGLTTEQIAALGPVSQADKDLAAYTARLEASAPKIACIEAWMASGYRDHHHLAGLGFDALIEAAQPVDEEVAP